MRITGTFLTTERKSGDFEGTPYDFTLMHVLDDVSVRKVRLPKGTHTVPFQRGDMIVIDVSVADNVKITTSPDDLAATVRGDLADAAA